MIGEPVVLNQQTRCALDLSALRRYVARVRQGLQLGRRSFNVCLMDDRGIRRLNGTFRGKTYPTDVLSFPWKGADQNGANAAESREFGNFLGDVVISVDTARRNAGREGHSTINEIRWLILHGALHLLGYDHEQDNGEMVRLELSLRERLGIAGSLAPRRRHAGARRAHV
ncbi:MAG: rRNA maturation RNase YbeY [Acidobacteriia bacterium]|nr:rRNA maturation RNase YbeY [Terriglobia bacterium]